MRSATSIAKSWISSLQSAITDQISEYSHCAFVNLVMIFQEPTMLTFNNYSYAGENGFNQCFENFYTCDCSAKGFHFKQPVSLLDDLQSINDFDYGYKSSSIKCTVCQRNKFKPKQQLIEFDFSYNVFHYMKKENSEDFQEQQQSQMSQEDQKEDQSFEVIQLCIPLKYREGKGLIEILDDFDESFSDNEADQQQSASLLTSQFFFYNLTMHGMMHNQDLMQYEQPFIHELRKKLKGKQTSFHRVQSNLSLDQSHILGQSLYESEYLSEVQSSNCFNSSQNSKSFEEGEEEEEQQQQVNSNSGALTFFDKGFVIATAALGTQIASLRSISSSKLKGISSAAADSAVSKESQSATLFENNRVQPSLIQSEYLTLNSGESADQIRNNQNYIAFGANGQEQEVLTLKDYDEGDNFMKNQGGDMGLNADYFYYIGKL